MNLERDEKAKKNHHARGHGRFFGADSDDAPQAEWQEIKTRGACASK